MEQKENISENVIQKKKTINLLSVNFLLLFILMIVTSYNQININSVNKGLGIKNSNPFDYVENFLGGDNKASSYKISSSKKLTGDLMQDSINLVISKGVPDIYGEEMGVTFDDVQGAMNIMKKYDPSNLKPKGSRIIPVGDDLQRYIDVDIKISCEYCCSAKSIIHQNGVTACGCAHSMAMRGLTAYLIQYHPEMSNDEILRELSRWKGLYFPKQMIKKMSEQLQNGNYTPDTASLVIGVELPDYGEGGGDAPLPSEIEDLPGMVGGC